VARRRVGSAHIIYYSSGWMTTNGSKELIKEKPVKLYWQQ
jgi:hypothetical protein